MKIKIALFFFTLLLLLPGAFVQTTPETVSAGIYLLNLGRFNSILYIPIQN